jgi:carbon monoxide dehydrogenase subunit G
MTTIQKSILINAPVERVGAVLDDPHRLPEWYAGVEQVDPEPGYPTEVGASNKVLYKAAGISFETKFTTREFGPHQRAFKIEGMINGTNQWQLAAEGEGTRVTVTFDYEMPGGGIGKIADRLFVERTNEKNTVTSLENLKGLVEG